jgi:hypothetical protein
VPKLLVTKGHRLTDPIFLYLDPGTGATLAQLALAGTAGIAAAAKLRMNKVKRRLNKASAEAETETGDEAEQVEESASNQ